MNPERASKPALPWLHKRYTFYLVIVFSVLFLALLVLLGNQYRSGVLHEKAVLLDDFRGRIGYMENLLMAVTARVEGLRGRAEWDLAEMRRVERSDPPSLFASLTEDEQGKFFHLDRISPPLTRKTIGNLTGVGSLQGRDAAFHAELHMALDLAPDFLDTSRTIKEAAWVYYMSASGFINICPWVSSSDFRFSNELYSHEFFRLGTPQMNPARKIFWTEVYADEYGKGLMTTCGAPVHDQDRFLGTVAIDLTVDFLNSIVKRFHPESGVMFLVNDRGQVLSHPTLVTSADRRAKGVEEVMPLVLAHNISAILAGPEDEFISMSGYELLRKRLNSAPWQVFYVRSVQSSPALFVERIGVAPLLLMACLLFMVVAVLRTTHRRYLVPSGMLVDFIVRRSRHDRPAGYDAVPSSWKPWFRTIDTTFSENEELNRKILKQNEELEQRVAERTMSLEESNRALRVQIDERRLAEEEKERLRQQLQRAQKMEAIGMLAGGVAHDLNNILSGILSYPEFILMSMSDDNPLRESIELIRHCGEKAAAVVQDLLTMARRGVAVSEVVNLNVIIEEYLRSPELAALLRRHDKARVSVELERGLLNIQGSPTHLAKSVMNLVTNAAEAMPDGGPIVIGTENVYVDRPIGGYDDVETGDYVVLTVADAGIGISREDRERIFEPFYTKKVMGRSGTGLGMSVVWGTVKDHRGYVDVWSEPGKGTRFILYFPATRERYEPACEAVDLDKMKGRGELVLIVDDVHEQREIGSQILRRLDYRVAAVDSGEAALEYMKSHAPDLMLLDMIMEPGMDGLETYEKILEIRPGQKTILVSGFSETERVRRALELGAGEYVKKPYSIEKVAAAVMKALLRQA